MSSQNYKDKLDQFINENNEIKFATLEGENTHERIANHFNTLRELLQLTGLQEILEIGNTTEAGTTLRAIGGIQIENFLKVSSNIGTANPEDPIDYILARQPDGMIVMKLIDEILGNIIEKLPPDDPEAEFLLRADGTRVDGKALSIKKYHQFETTQLTGDFSEMYDDFLAEHGLTQADDVDRNILNDVHFLIENGTDNIVIELDVDGFYNITLSRTGIGIVTFTRSGQSLNDNILSGLAKSMILVKSVGVVKQVSSSIS